MKRNDPIGKGFLVLVAAGLLLSGWAAPALPDSAGTIKGVVKTPWVKRYEGLVYIDKVEGKTFPPRRKRSSWGRRTSSSSRMSFPS